VAVVAGAAVDSGRPGRRLLAQREGIFLNTEDVAVVQKKADKDAAAQKAAAIVKYQSHPHKYVPALIVFYE
jgi:hypothetical protein